MTRPSQDPPFQRLKEILAREVQHASQEKLPATSPDALLLRGIVRDRVGGFFSNAYPPDAPGVCGVCRGPSGSGLCGPCDGGRRTFGDLLADRTILLTYAVGNMPGGRHQSAHHMLTYKGYRGTPPVHECSEDLQLMISVMVDMHRKCLQSWLGHTWDALTFVPSKERPDATHPVAALANATLPKFNFATAPMPKFLMRPGPGSDIKRKMTADRFEIDERWRQRVQGKHVLIVDDTWTTGASAQGAAIAVKTAGAATATILCIARWLRWDWDDHRTLIDSLGDGFDVLRCPVHGRPCAAVKQYSVSASQT